MSLKDLKGTDFVEAFRMENFPTCTDCSVHVDSIRRKQVFPRGPMHASVIIVGEAPGATEESMGLTFVGAAGQKLETTLRNLGVDTSEIYVTNTLKCRPLNNRDPSTDECKKCREKYLVNELSAFPRQLIITLGNYGYYGVFPKGTPTGVTSRCGVLEKCDEFNCFVLPCLHPAAVLRNPSQEPIFQVALEKAVNFINDGFVNKRASPVTYKEIHDFESLYEFRDEVVKAKVLGADIECLSEDTLLLDEATGRVKSIREIVERRLPWRVSSYNTDGCMELEDVTNWIEKGKLECFRIVAEYGWEVEASSNHFMLTHTGWKKVSDLSTDDYLARPRTLPFHTVSDVLCDEDIVFLGYWVAEGCVADSPTLSICDLELETDLLDHVSKFGYELHKFGIDKGSSEVSIKRVVVERRIGHENRFRELLLKTQLNDIRSINRFIPEDIFCLPKEKLALFLSRLFAGDGSVDLKGRRVEYSTSSRILALQLCHLLLRFGIIPRVAGVMYDTSDKPGYHIFIEGKDTLTKFAHEIGIFGRKGTLLVDVIERSSENASVRNSIPRVVCKSILDELLVEHTVTEIFGEFVYSNYAERIKFKALEQLAKFDQRFETFLKGDIYWAKITSIESVGEKRVYDLSVPKNHNFVAGMYIVHNTTGFNHREDKILCMTLSTAPYTAWYLPMIEDDIWVWPRDDWTCIQEILRSLFEDVTIAKVGFNIKFDMEFFVFNFDWNIRGQLDDPMLMHYLLNENDRHDLKTLAARHTDLGNYSVELDQEFKTISRSKIPPKEKHYGKIATNVRKLYAMRDVDATMRLFDLFRSELKTLPKLFMFYRQYIIPTLTTLMEMEMIGIHVDKEQMSKLDIVMEGQLDELQQKINSVVDAERIKIFQHQLADLQRRVKTALTGEQAEEIQKELDILLANGYGPTELNVKSHQQLTKFLFEELKLTVVNTTDTGAASSNEESLLAIAKEHEIVPLIIAFRKLYKLHGTYIVGLLENIADDGRLHTSYLQHGTVCVTGETLVNTNKGIVPIKSLCTQNVGEFSPVEDLFVYGTNGTQPVEYTLYSGERDTISITTKFGFHLRGTSEHPVLIAPKIVLNNARKLNHDHHTKWVKLNELRKGNYIGLPIGMNCFMRSVELPVYVYPVEHFRLKTISVPTVLTSEVARFLGYLWVCGELLSEYHAQMIVLRTREPNVRSDMLNIGRTVYNVEARWDDRSGYIRINSHPFYSYLRFLYGLDPHEDKPETRVLKHLARVARDKQNEDVFKRLPTFITHATREAQIEFLRGAFIRAKVGTYERCIRQEFHAIPEIVVPFWNYDDAEIVKLMLLNLGYVSCLVHKSGMYGCKFNSKSLRGRPYVIYLKILGVDATNFAKEIGFISGELVAQTKDWNFTLSRVCSSKDAYFLKRTPKHLWLQVLEIVPSGKAAVYDLTVADGSSFVTNGIMSHNTGRLSSSRPALQNIPRDSTIKSLFIPTKDWYLISNDYAQHELRVLANYSKDEKFIEALSTSDVHSTIGSILLNKPMDQISKEERVTVKTVIFGLAYGRGPKSVAEDLGISYAEAEKFQKLFFEMYPETTKWLYGIEDYARKYKQVTNLFGRIRRLSDIDSIDSGKQAEALRQARNSVVQSASSDITNLALSRIHKEFKRLGMKSRLLLQVHDEILAEAPKEELFDALDIIKTQMLAPVPKMTVPLAADQKVQLRWGEKSLDLDELRKQFEAEGIISKKD